MKNASFKVVIKTAALSPEETEIRLRKAFDIVFEEVLRAREFKRRRHSCRRDPRCGGNRI